MVSVRRADSLAGGPSRSWPAGALIAAVFVYRVAPETHGHGTDVAIQSINTAPRRIRLRSWPVRLIGSAITIGSGGSGGSEGPTAQMSAAIASQAARWMKLDEADARKAVTAGLASGVGAIFRAPLGGAMLGVELLFRDDADPGMLVPSMIASFVAYLEFGAVFGFTPMFGHQLGFAMAFSTQLLAFPVLGICAGLLAKLYCWFFYAASDWFAKLRGPRPLRVGAAGLAVGFLGLVVPGVLGTGYGTIQDVMSPDRVAHLSLLLLLAMPLAKLLATSLSVGSGGSGGVFGPGLVIGATAGAALWRIAEPLGWAPSSPAPLVIVGMAACLGAAARAPIAITLIAIETTGNFSLLAPATIAVPLAVIIVGKQTLYRSQPETRAALADAIGKRPQGAPARTPSPAPTLISAAQPTANTAAAAPPPGSAAAAAKPAGPIRETRLGTAGELSSTAKAKP